MANMRHDIKVQLDILAEHFDDLHLADDNHVVAQCHDAMRSVCQHLVAEYAPRDVHRVLTDDYMRDDVAFYQHVHDLVAAEHGAAAP